jgi:hypothetical protein
MYLEKHLWLYFSYVRFLPLDIHYQTLRKLDKHEF